MSDHKLYAFMLAYTHSVFSPVLLDVDTCAFEPTAQLCDKFLLSCPGSFATWGFARTMVRKAISHEFGPLRCYELTLFQCISVGWRPIRYMGDPYMCAR